MRSIFNFLPGGVRWRALAASSLLVLMAGAEAGAQPSAPPLSLPQALQQTLLHNADLQVFPYQLRKNDARALEAARKPMPSLELEVENAFARSSGSRLERPFTDSDVTLALSQVIELGDKRQRRMEQVRVSAESLYSQYELARLDVLAEAARRYYDVLRQQQLRSWITRRIELEQDALATARVRADAGALSRAEVTRLQLRLARSEALQLDLAGDLDLARLQLSAMWGGLDPVPEVSGELTPLPTVPDIPSLRATVENTPAFLHHATTRRLAAAELRLQQSYNKPDASLTVGIRHLGVESDEGLVFSLDVPLGQGRGNRGRIAEAQAEVDLQDAQQALTATAMAAALGQIRQRMANAHAMATRLEEQLLPLSRQLLEDIREGYVRGQFDVIQWLDAQSELVALERDLIEARYTVHLQLLELEQMTGQPLAGNGMSMLPEQYAREVSP